MTYEYQALCVTDHKPEKYISFEMSDEGIYPENNISNITEIIRAINSDLEYSKEIYRVVDVFGIIKENGELELWEDIKE